MPSSALVSAASTAAFGALPIPTLSAWTPAAFYNACQFYLKMLILANPFLFIINAPFGRFALPDSALRLPGNLAFALMEIPGPILCILTLSSTEQLSNNETYGDAGSFLISLLSPSLSKLRELPIANVILASLYVIHYTHRSVLQPLYGPKRSPSHLAVFLSAFLCQVSNGFTMGSWLGGRSPALLIPTNLLSASAVLKSAKPLKSASWFASVLTKSRSDTAALGLPTSTVLPLAQAGLLPHGTATLLHPTFLIGVTGWAVFFLLNAYHDEILFNLRRPAKRGGGPAQGTRANEKSGTSEKGASPRYEIPYAGLYSWISYPNYFTEWLEWSFFALAALSQTPLSPLSTAGPPLTTMGRLSLLATSPPALFVIMEVAVMLPRAVKGHQWYQTKFGVEGDGKGGRYPADRKAVIPYLL